MRLNTAPKHPNPSSVRLRKAILTSLKPLEEHERIQQLLTPRPSHAFPYKADPAASAASPLMLGSNIFNPRMPSNALSLPSSPLAYAMILTPSVSFFKYLMAFIAGGLFFSSSIAIVTATYAMGMDNVQRIVDLVLYIAKKVWDSFVAGLQTAKVALLGEIVPDAKTGKPKRQWNAKKAWQVLKEELVKTRQQAAEGVQAIREEATLYKAAVGPPGLIPLQHILDQLMPYSLTNILEDSLKDSLKDFKASKFITKLTLSSFTAGTRAPTLEAARVYDVPNAIAFDYKVKWDSEIEATVQVSAVGGLARIPVSIRKIQFDGTVRVILTPLMKESPGFGAALISLPTTPDIGLDVRVAGGEVTKVPWLRSELVQGIQKGVDEQLAWPCRLVTPMLTPNQKPLLSAADLKKLESTDPLLQGEQERNSQPILKETRENQQSQKSLRKRMKILLKDEAEALDEEADEKLQGEATKELLETDTAKISPLELEPKRHPSTVQRGIFGARLKELFAARREAEEIKS